MEGSGGELIAPATTGASRNARPNAAPPSTSFRLILSLPAVQTAFCGILRMVSGRRRSRRLPCLNGGTVSFTADLRSAVAPIARPIRSHLGWWGRSRRRARYLRDGIEGIAMELRTTTNAHAEILREYGARVDALINVNYQSDPANNVFATAVAVHFTETRSHADTASTRMGELEQLRKNGLIDQREYEQKRAEILRGL